MKVDANPVQSFFHVLMMEFLFLQVKDKKPIVIFKSLTCKGKQSVGVSSR
jgi:hypothetical protein